MIAAIPTFRETLMRARRERIEIVCRVLMGDDRILVVRFGPRGGWVALND